MLGTIAATALLALSPATGPIADQLTPNKAAIEVTSMPANSTGVHVAVMPSLTPESSAIKYLNLTLAQAQQPYTPPPADPVVDVQALVEGKPSGAWAGRLQTVPGGVSEETQAEKEAREKREREEREARERLEREQREQREREEAERPPMIVSVDAGGWDWESAIRDFSGAVKYVRSSYEHYNSDSQMGILAKYGVRLLPLFGEGGCLASYNTTSYTNEIVTWFKRYGHGGTFWAGKTDLGATTAEIINEPGNPYLTCESSNRSLYAQITRRVHAALEANFPTATRPKELVSYDGGFSGDQYGREIFADGAQADGVTVHPYGGHSSVTKSAEGNRPRVTEAHGSGLPVYVTEVGWPTCGETGDSLNWTEAQQAENIKNFVVWAHGLGYVADVTNFNYADYTGNCYGIVKSAGSPHKLSYAALASVAGL